MFFELLNLECKKVVILAKKGRDGDEKNIAIFFEKLLEEKQKFPRGNVKSPARKYKTSRMKI